MSPTSPTGEGPTQGVTDTIVIDTRHCGPPRSANGGYVCGQMAQVVERAPAQAVRVELRAPPPLGRALERRAGAKASLWDEGRLLAQAEAVDLAFEPPAPVSLEAAEAASQRYVGFESHAYPTCFVCGPDRGQGDGLRIFAGSLDPDTEGRPRVAAPWVPTAPALEGEGHVDPVLVWAALDCPGYFAVAQGGELALLASMTARVDSAPRPGEACIVMGWGLGREGRKLHAATAVFDARGRTLAWSRQLWIVVKALPDGL